jgi:hypothetical protein
MCDQLEIPFGGYVCSDGSAPARFLVDCLEDLLGIDHF